MTNEPMFIKSHSGLGSIDFIENEKIYYCSTPLYYKDSTIFLLSFDTILNPNEEKEYPLRKSFNIDYTKFHYVFDDDVPYPSLIKIDDGQSDIISFRLLYTKESFIVADYSYYIDYMKTSGYYAVGYQKDDKIIFDIYNHVRIDKTHL
ncbi:MAG: hypothetical protein LBI28_14810 [Treponema sp.]|nr:hypothetical protein [Treponema sp.]